MHAIEIDTLSKSYGQRRGVRSLSLAVPDGALYGFLGPNGAGKTTTIRVLMGLLRPSSGAARLFGLDAWTQSKQIKHDVGYVPGDLRLHAWLTGNDALAIFSRVRRRPLLPLGRDLADLLELDLSVRVRQMSRGMRQKLGLILAMAHNPRLLILDEPTSALDPLMQARFHTRLRSLTASGHTVFFSSHTLGEVEQLCDHVAIVKEGRLVANEPLDALRRRSGYDVSIQFRADAPAAIPVPSLTVASREGNRLTASLEGPVEPLLAWLATQNVDDVTIARPDLETLFRRFYLPDAEGDTP